MFALNDAQIDWEKPASLKTGDVSEDVLFTAVGKALTAWEYVEERCASLFALFVESRSHAAARSYGCIRSTSSKMEVLGFASVEFFFSHEVTPADSGPCKRIHRHVSDGATRRNEIAHGMVCRFAKPPGHTQYFLMPGRYNTPKIEPPRPLPKPPKVLPRDVWLDPTWARPDKYRFTAEYIDRYTANFRWLEAQLAGTGIFSNSATEPADLFRKHVKNSLSNVTGHIRTYWSVALDPLCGAIDRGFPRTAGGCA